MAYTPSLAPELYTDADTSIDTQYRELMREQDKTPVSTDVSKPRFTLIVGPSPFSMPRGWEFFLTSPYEGATYISTVLHNAGFPVRIIDVRYSADPLREAMEGIRAGTDVLGICTFEDNFPFCRQLMEMARTEQPDVPIICGGSLVTSVPHIFMNYTPCDVAVISEGEITILEVMEAYEKGQWKKRLPLIRGIWFRDQQGRAVATAPRGQMMDLDALPKMRLDLWPAFHSEQGLQPEIIASYSRGCKMDCSFCYRTTPQERSKSPAKLDEDLTWLKEQYGTEFIFFVDLTFTAHKKQTLEILEAIEGKDLRWTCLTRNADVDPERIAKMRDAGADIILYGVESLGREVLKECRKGSTENLTVRAQRMTWDAGVRYGGLLIVGMPAEDAESLEQMCQWAESHGSITRVKYLSAMPGTTVYNQGIESGLLRSEIDHLNWLSIEQALIQDEFLNYTGLPEQMLRDAYKRVYDSYCPGPVMDFNHYPEVFEYHHGNDEDGAQRSVDYAGDDWRATHSSCAPRLVPGSEKFTLEHTGVVGSVEAGAGLSWATEMRDEQFAVRESSAMELNEGPAGPPAK